MKVKTSLTLSEELISIIDKKSTTYKSRSDFIENALWTYLNYLIRHEKNKRDLRIINENSDSLNREAQDVLDYQALI
jgi:metal-responsive CopG/Arc/MetJ family transcriptional regulator